jgi:putative DNA primase/helicase
MSAPETFAARAALVTVYGIPVIPLESQSKRAVLKDWQNRATADPDQTAKWNKQNPNSNCGAVARKGEFWMLDVDDPNFFDQLKKETGHSLDKLDTLVVKSSGEKRHFYLKHNSRSEAMGNFSEYTEVGEVFSARCLNQYVVSAGSIHPITKQQYEIVSEPTFGEIPEAPSWLLDYLEPLSKKSKGAERIEKVTDTIPEHARNNTLTSIAGAMRRRGLSKAAILFALRETNRERCSPPLPEHDLEVVAKSVSKYEPAKNETGRTQIPFAESGGSPPTNDHVEESWSEIISVRASDVVPTPIEFLWEPYLQQDALNAFYGNPSVGKGNTGIDILARLTTARPFPTESTTDRKPMDVVILAAEENVESTLVPRLMSAGADLHRVRIIRSIRFHGKHDKISDRLITFQADLSALKADLMNHPEDRFLLIDPITNYVGDINFNQDGEVRPVLTLLVQLAEEMKITILMVGHFNKNSGVASALDKPGGGRAWTAVPRAVWGFFRRPENKNQRLMVNLKLNNAKESETGLIFTISERVIGTKPNGKPWGASCVEWGGTTDSSADEIVASEHPEARRDSKGVDFLTHALKDRARQASEVYSEAATEGVSDSTLKRACGGIGVLKFKTTTGCWFWQHPSDPTPIPDAARELNAEAQCRRVQHAQGGQSETSLCQCGSGPLPLTNIK